MEMLKWLFDILESINSRSIVYVDGSNKEMEFLLQKTMNNQTPKYIQ
jgi:GTP-dependent phosphoenolpyruvate carboxykinase